MVPVINQWQVCWQDIDITYILASYKWGFITWDWYGVGPDPQQGQQGGVGGAGGVWGKSWWDTPQICHHLFILKFHSSIVDVGVQKLTRKRMGNAPHLCLFWYTCPSWLSSFHVCWYSAKSGWYVWKDNMSGKIIRMICLRTKHLRTICLRTKHLRTKCLSGNFVC